MEEDDWRKVTECGLVENKCKSTGKFSHEKNVLTIYTMMLGETNNKIYAMMMLRETNHNCIRQLFVCIIKFDSCFGYLM